MSTISKRCLAAIAVSIAAIISIFTSLTPAEAAGLCISKNSELHPTDCVVFEATALGKLRPASEPERRGLDLADRFVSDIILVPYRRGLLTTVTIRCLGPSDCADPHWFSFGSFADDMFDIEYGMGVRCFGRSGKLLDDIDVIYAGESASETITSEGRHALQCQATASAPFELYIKSAKTEHAEMEW